MPKLCLGIAALELVAEEPAQEVVHVRAAPEKPAFWALAVVKTFTTPGLTFLTTGAKLARPAASRDTGRSSRVRLTGVGLRLGLGGRLLRKCERRAGEDYCAAQREGGKSVC